MKADSYKISKVFSDGGKIHYVLPHFQREYRWEEKHWNTLLEDAFAVYEVLANDPTAKMPEHFLGALVVLPDGTISLNIPVFRLVDGQQRLTTISLLLCAFGAVMNGAQANLHEAIRSYLFNANEEGDARLKLLPTLKNGDRDAYRTVLLGESLPLHQSRIPAAFEFFKKHLQKRLDGGDFVPETFFKVVAAAMQVVFIELNEGENAYQIFESLNNKAEPLKQSDLVRNYIAMRLSSHKQEKVFQQHWAPIETLLNDNVLVGRLGELTGFLRHYDAMRGGTLPSETHVYARFRDEMKNRAPEEADLIAELATLRRYATYYDGFLRPQFGQNPAIRAALERIRVLELSTAYPFLMRVASHLDEGTISVAQYVEALQVLENYLVRRFLVADQSNYLTRMFPILERDLDWNDFVPSLRLALLGRNYPSDARIRQVLPGRSLYDKNAAREKTVMLFERINAHLLRGTDVTTVLNGAPTLEHILPQKPSSIWESELGEELEPTKREWLHSLGNLTLVTQSYNSSLGNDSFAEKKTKLVKHGLRLNSDYFAHNIELWNAEAIQERAMWLTEKILEIWPSFAPAREPQAPPISSAPTHLTIGRELFVVGSWRDVTRRVIDYVAKEGADFSQLSVRLPGYFRQSPFPSGRSYDIGNGWHIYVDLTRLAARELCKEILDFVGVKDDEWFVEEKAS